MKPAPEVVANLQSILAAEAHLNIWYRNAWRVVKHLGVKGSANSIKSLGTRAHKFMKLVKDRLLDLGADTTYSVGEIADTSSLTTTFKEALALESGLVDLTRAGVGIAVTAKDEATAEKLRHIEERHEDNVVWLGEQLTLIAGMGEPLYAGAHLKK